MHMKYIGYTLLRFRTPFPFPFHFLFHLVLSTFPFSFIFLLGFWFFGRTTLRKIIYSFMYLFPSFSFPLPSAFPFFFMVPSLPLLSLLFPSTPFPNPPFTLFRPSFHRPLGQAPSLSLLHSLGWLPLSDVVGRIETSSVVSRQAPSSLAHRSARILHGGQRWGAHGGGRAHPFGGLEDLF